MPIDGQLVFARYRRVAGRLFIDHVEASPARRGTGAADTFMKALAADARASGEKIVPLCGYAAAWLRRRPEYRDILD